MRIALFALLALNLVYLAWAGWVDTPSAPLVNEAEARLPRLMLASEQPRDAAVSPTSAGAPPGQAIAALAAQPNGAGIASSDHCVSVGPFGDLAHAARGAALLRERGFTPRQRAEEGETWQGFWVYVGGLKSAAEEANVLRSLERAGIQDAHAMAETAGERRVSIGLFSERARAERRALAVKRLGLAPEITERRQVGTVYWVDLDLGTGERSVPTEGLLSLEETGSRLEIRVCPGRPTAPAPSRPEAPQRDALPASTTADIGPLPG